jgi:chromosome segregation ATPase
MSKAPKKAAAAAKTEDKAADTVAAKPVDASAASETAKDEAADSAEKPAEKPAKEARSPIEEAIELALASASTAVDSAQEIQRLRGEVKTLIAGHNRNNKILIYAVLLILSIASAGVFGALVFYKRGFNEFDATAKVNREALTVFAGEINGLVAASKKIDESIKASAVQLKESQIMQEDLRKTIQGLTVGQAALANKINAPAPAVPNTDKSIAALQKSLDDLLAANKVIAQRIGEIQAKQVTPPPPPPKPVAAPSAAQRAQAARARDAVREREMIRYP